MKVHQKLLGVALVTALGVLSLPKEAIAALTQNGASLNGASLNGPGLGMNGATMNGTSFNGPGLGANGVSLKQLSQGNKLNLNPQPEPPGEEYDAGLTLSSPSFAGIKVEGGRLVGVK